MKAALLKETIALGAITGMRTMAGPVALACRRGGALMRVMVALGAGEMVADKTSLVGDRIDAIPLAGRALMGALVGGLLARGEHDDVVLGGIVGASSAIAAAHLAYRVRKGLPVPPVLGGLLEDAIVVATAAACAPAVSPLMPFPSARRS
jgi:hypothetical protein